MGNSKYLKGELVYQKEHDRFRCPAGKYLTPTPAIIENHKRYVSVSADCQACAQASTCPARTRGSSPQRFVLRNLDQDLFEEVQARMRDPTFRTKRSERMWKMEGLFAEAKQNHGLSRARYRGRSKVQIQAYFERHRSKSEAVGRCAVVLAHHTVSKRPQRHHPNHRFCQKTTYSTGPTQLRELGNLHAAASQTATLSGPAAIRAASIRTSPAILARHFSRSRTAGRASRRTPAADQTLAGELRFIARESWPEDRGG